MPFLKVCPINEISSEKPKKFTLPEQEILIAKSSDNRIWAFQAICTHADKPLEKGKWDPDTAQITCPFHKAIFSIAEAGAVKAPPAFVALPVYKVEVREEDGNHFIFVEVDS